MKKAVTYTLIVGSDICPYNCSICISEMTPTHGLRDKLVPVNWRNFDLAKDIALNYKAENILITDKREPTVYPERITEYLEKLRNDKFNKRELQTNGSIIATGKLDDYLKKWYDSKLTTIAVSIYHYDKEKNQEIFRPRNGEYLILEKLIDEIHNNELEVRLSCVVLKDYIDTPKEAEKLLEFVRRNGVEQVTFRTADIPKNPRNLEIANYIREHRLTKKELQAIGKFIIEKAGKACDVLPFGAKVYEIGKQQVATTTGLTPYKGDKFLSQIRRIFKGDEELRQLIFFPQGLLTTSWETIYGSAILRGWTDEQIKRHEGSVLL